MRIGIGYDVHRLVRGRPLRLGGVLIDSEWGLAGHSDADALLHAIGDALLGALALGDLGHYFPDTDPAYRGISSATLLESVMQMVRGRHYRLHNLDAVVIAQRPRLAVHLPAIRRNLAELLLTDLGSVSVKAKTAESLGALGRGEGIAVQAVCLLAPEGC
ncbi:MAG TPA: 2-C-methyl-D-erythritol 2,4-cyclodiphosphate synthase [Candidatus Tectomicrobia bacterium]|nr:2-C-methyl-D-erythritol 2,4-cyclodiphosphate synthase [Candidatus Tectomicrobia bacterium]